MTRCIARWLLSALLACAGPACAQDALYTWQDNTPGWASPENPQAAQGAGGVENRGAKGHPYQSIPAGGTQVLADVTGPGVIDRLWMTVNDRSPAMLRALRLQITWDDAATPAVSVPLGDLFGAGAGALVPMETALVASPEGRSFVSWIPMPFQRHARVELVNESSQRLDQVFFDVDFHRVRQLPSGTLYFHAWWHRERATTPGRAFQILPPVQGRGRWLGALVTVFTDPRYGATWWGEGEMKLYLDGDTTHPTLVGTGTEDYIGTGWGQGAYVQRFQGAPVADEAHGRWTFYRFHVPDPVFFAHDLRVELQQIGGAPKAEVLAMQARGVPLQPVSIDSGGGRAGFVPLLAGAAPMPLDHLSLPQEGWTNFYRSDDVSAVALFYLDKAENGLPPIAPVAERTAGLRPPAP
ncbi:glycoside hydrolase family 172 protein [Pseudoxanthomonas sp. JBR18]|uniref:glycoside hydrolase family 172 protein n=1 Tax=Pseudoxanthomonas sp. JBR18 TaxID=2969308 RepID=UPI0023062BFE|nr:glycoside hydrolase family 172 protein [Pseudoxanthomonas sp. JBR18]WCE02567.1 DUF2961 domain-containing protein [Pseudoxanthomonas sp. JBR18]